MERRLNTTKKKLPTEIYYEVLDCVEAQGDIESVKESEEFDALEIKIKMHGRLGASGTLYISTEGMSKVVEVAKQGRLKTSE